MERYENLGGDSGVSSYEISSDSIEVQFHDGMIYSWDSGKAGDANIEQMKLLAVAGSGLISSFSLLLAGRQSAICGMWHC